VPGEEVTRAVVDEPGTRGAAEAGQYRRLPPGPSSVGLGVPVRDPDDEVACDLRLLDTANQVDGVVLATRGPCDLDNATEAALGV
jgi:hypothetical protein